MVLSKMLCFLLFNFLGIFFELYKLKYIFLKYIQSLDSIFYVFILLVVWQFQRLYDNLKQNNNLVEQYFLILVLIEVLKVKNYKNGC